MSEQANTRLVQQAYQRIAMGDMPSLLHLLAADVQWQLPDMENVPFAGLWQGRQQVKQFFGIVDQVQEMVEFQPNEFIAQGDKVIVLGRFTMRVKSTGRDSNSDWAHVWTVKDGEITHFREYVDTVAVIRSHTVAQASRRS